MRLAVVGWGAELNIFHREKPVGIVRVIEMQHVIHSAVIMLSKFHG
jgi:hypothetical protein